MKRISLVLFVTSLLVPSMADELFAVGPRGGGGGIRSVAAPSAHHQAGPLRASGANAGPPSRLSSPGAQNAIGQPPIGQRLRAPVRHVPRPGAAGSSLHMPGPLGHHVHNHPVVVPAGSGSLLPVIYRWTATHPQPFSNAWYARHPNAWRFAHPYAGRTATIVTTAAIVSWFASPVPAGGYTTVVTEGDTYVENRSNPSESAATLNQDAKDSAIASDPREWMEIGVYTLKPADQANATRMLQISTAKDGTLRGFHYDLLSEETDSLQGSVDKEQLVATWTIGMSDSVSFTASLDELTKPVGNVLIHLPDGQSIQWETTRVNP